MSLSGSEARLRKQPLLEAQLLLRKQPYAVRDWDTTLLMPFSVPSIRSVNATLVLAAEATQRLHLPLMALTRLVLKHGQIQPSTLNSLFAVTPNLRYLEYHAHVDQYWFHLTQHPNTPITHALTGLEPLFTVIHHAANSLEELITSQEFTDEEYRKLNKESYYPRYKYLFRHSNELSKMKKLRKFSIPYRCLLSGHVKRDPDWTQFWNDLLSASLRKIVLTDDIYYCFKGCTDEWSDETLMSPITALVDWLATHNDGIESPELKL